MDQRFVVYTERELEALFDRELAAVRLAGADELVIGRLQFFRRMVIREAASRGFPEGHLPFAPEFGEDGRIRFVYGVAPRPKLLTAALGKAITVREPAPAPLAVVPVEASLPAGVAPVLGGLMPFLNPRRAVEAHARTQRGDETPIGQLFDLFA